MGKHEVGEGDLDDTVERYMRSTSCIITNPIKSSQCTIEMNLKGTRVEQENPHS